MAILIDKNTRVLVQGITGNEGSRAAREMVAYGTKVLAGVTPGKGGQKVEAQVGKKKLKIPVFNSVKEALKKFPEINASVIVVPGPFAKDAALEAIYNKIPVINILSDHMPVQDCAIIYAEARKTGIIVVGPSSIGIMSPGKSKLGAIGTGEVSKVFTSGSVGVISKSGGMTAEICSVLSKARIGQSTAVGIGGDQIICSDFVDIMKLFRDDKKTKAVVIFGEVGGTYEEQLAEWIRKEKFKKPVIAVIAGKFGDQLPKETVLGHAGAIVSQGRGSYKSKIISLNRVGVHIIDSLEEMPRLLKKLVNMRVYPIDK